MEQNQSVTDNYSNCPTSGPDSADCSVYAGRVDMILSVVRSPCSCCVPSLLVKCWRECLCLVGYFETCHFARDRLWSNLPCNDAGGLKESGNLLSESCPFPAVQLWWCTNHIMQCFHQGTEVAVCEWWPRAQMHWTPAYIEKSPISQSLLLYHTTYSLLRGWLSQRNYGQRWAQDQSKTNYKMSPFYL